MRWFLVVLSLLLFQASPTITVSPDSGQTGAPLVVNGSAFTAGARVKVLWDGANLGGTLEAGADGTFRYSGSVPADAAVGSHSVTAKGVGGAKDSATATFTVVGPTTTTTATTTTTSIATTTTTATTTTSAGVLTTVPTTTLGETPTTTAASTLFGAASVAETDPTVESLTSASGAVGGTGDAPTSTTLLPSSAPPPGPGTTSDESSGSPGLLGVWSILAALILGAVLFFAVRRRSHRDRETEPLAPVPVVEETGTLEPLVAADIRAGDGDWTRDMMTLDPSGAIDGIIPNSNGLIAFGQAAGENGDGRQAAVWESSDGINWKNVAMLGPGSARFAVPWQNGLLVATVREHDERIDTTCWWSDDGATWNERGRDEELLRGVAIEGGTATDDVAVMWGRGHDGPRVWSSKDGATWQESSLRGGVDLVGHLDGTFVAFGRDRNARPTVAYSADGLSWDESSADNPVVFEGARMVTAVPFEGRFVAAGTDIMRGAAATWATDDGRRWHRASLASATSTHLTDLVVAGDRLLAVGGVRAGGRKAVVAWESRDAMSWKPVATPRLFADATAKAVQVIDDSVVVCGTLYVERDDDRVESAPVTWRSRIPDRNVPSVPEAGNPAAVGEPEPVATR